nr:virulence factor MviM [Salmonella sp. NCTC 7297]
MNGAKSAGRVFSSNPFLVGQTTLEQRGFVGCARHFIDCVQNQTVPETAGEQAILAQRVVETLWRDAISE